MMSKLMSLYLGSTLLLTMFVICRATTYTVGDSSGWDISTDLDSWSRNKTFYVGDVLSFQYSSSNSVEEVDKDSFDNCNTTNALQTFSNDNGNTSIPLTRTGGWYFTSGNRLYCLGGMKLQVDAIITNNSIAPSPYFSQSSPPTASKTDNPTSSATDAPQIIHYFVSVVYILLHIIIV